MDNRFLPSGGSSSRSSSGGSSGSSSGGGGSSSGGGGRSSSSGGAVYSPLPIAVTPINDPPVIQLPFATIRIDENAAAYVGDVAMKYNIQISDPNRLNVTADTMGYSIQLFSYAGSFTLLAGDGEPVRIDKFWAVDYSRDAQNSSLITNGTLHDLNMVLSGVMYQPKPKFVGQDRIIVHVVDSQLAAADPETIYVLISPTEHLPHIVIKKQQLIVHEDSILRITDVSEEIGNYFAAESQVRSYHSRCCKHFYKFLMEEH